MTQRNLVIAAFITTCFASACSSHSDGGSDTPTNPAATAFDNKIAGTALEGNWVSQCGQDMVGQFRKRTTIFKGQTIDRTDTSYADKDCTQQTSKYEAKGYWRFNSKTNYGGFLLDYHFDLGNGVYQITGEEVLIEGPALYLSGFQIGFGSIDKTLPMTIDGAPLPTPVPTPVPPTPAPAPVPDADPATVEGIPAVSWSEVKYAFCNVQFNGILLDFQGQDLSTATSGTIKVSTRACNTTGSFTPMDDNTFSLQRSGQFLMTLGNGYIQDNGGGFVNSSALIGGNSGRCVFLTNKGIKDLFPGDVYAGGCN